MQCLCLDPPAQDESINLGSDGRKKGWEPASGCHIFMCGEQTVTQEILSGVKALLLSFFYLSLTLSLSLSPTHTHNRRGQNGEFVLLSDLLTFTLTITSKVTVFVGTVHRCVCEWITVCAYVCMYCGCLWICMYWGVGVRKRDLSGWKDSVGFMKKHNPDSTWHCLSRSLEPGLSKASMRYENKIINSWQHWWFTWRSNPTRPKSSLLHWPHWRSTVLHPGFEKVHLHLFLFLLNNL